MPKPKRVNKTKAELEAQMKQSAKIARMVALVKLMWPFVESQETIYDTQTVFNALGGYIEQGLKIKEDETKVSDLGIDLSGEKDTKIKKAMVDLVGLMEIENARDMVTLTRKVADILGQHGANQFLKGPMSSVKVTDIVS